MSSDDAAWADSLDSPASPVPDVVPPDASAYGSTSFVPTSTDEGKEPVRKFRGIPEDVRLFEVFWYQVVELIKVHSFSFIISTPPTAPIRTRLDQTCQYRT